MDDSIKISGRWDQLPLEEDHHVVRVDGTVIYRFTQVHDNGDGTWTAEIPKDTLLAKLISRGIFSDNLMHYSIAQNDWHTVPVLCELRPIDPLD